MAISYDRASLRNALTRASILGIRRHPVVERRRSPAGSVGPLVPRGPARRPASARTLHRRARARLSWLSRGPRSQGGGSSSARWSPNVTTPAPTEPTRCDLRRRAPPPEHRGRGTSPLLPRQGLTTGHSCTGEPSTLRLGVAWIASLIICWRIASWAMRCSWSFTTSWRIASASL